jgi:hypothetical protein
VNAVVEGDRWSVDGSWYRLSGTAGGPVAWLDDATGRWAELRLLASVDTVGAADETFAIDGPTIVEGDAATRLTWTLTSSIWKGKRLVFDLRPDRIVIGVEVSGRGSLGDVSLLGGRVVQPRASGWLMSGAWFHTLVSANPAAPARIAVPARESTSIGVASGSEPGRGRWFFTPAPFVFAVSRSETFEATHIPDGPWLAFAIDAEAGQAGFVDVAYRTVDHGFAIVLDYDGHTGVDGTWTSPPLVLTAAADPFAAIAAQRDRQVGTTAARPTTAPRWWREPMFCGWGAQCALAAAAGRPMSAAAAEATELNYDRFLDELEGRGIIPGTVVIDDKWQLAYGANEADPAKWPDLGRWIRDRHARDQRVLLWYKAWDPEGFPDDWSVRTTAGTPIGVDPTNPEAEAAVRATVRRMLASDGLDADGLKIDFTARTPTGRATVHHGTAWGVDLLAALLAIVADEARRVRPDALLIGHAPNTLVAPWLDMIRLNDALRLDDPEPATDIVPQMRYRAAVVRAACPDHPIDTDDWSAPDLAGWRAYTAIKGELGVPALYYATHIDRTGEALDDTDYALIRSTWAAYRRASGLSPRGRD